MTIELGHGKIIDDITDVLQAFDRFLSYTGYMGKYAEATMLLNQRGRFHTATMDGQQRNKGNDEALLEMFRNCYDLAHKYRLPIRTRLPRDRDITIAADILDRGNPARNNQVGYTDPDGRTKQPSANARMLASGNAEHINKLHPSIRDTVSNMLSDLAVQGINVGIVASMRTIEQQNAEYQKGRDENLNDIPGALRTTWVQGGYSYHNYGLVI